MAWGAGPSQGVDDWVRRLEADDPSLTSITVLRARKFGTPEVVALCEALRCNSTLTSLQASGRSLEAPAVRALASMLAANRSLRSLCIGDATFGDSGAALLAEGLRCNPTLQELDLSSRGVGPAGAALLAQALSYQREGTPALTNSAVDSVTADGAPSAGPPVVPIGRNGATTGLQTLDLSLNPLGCEGGAAIAASVPGLCHLNLSGCGIGSEGARALGAAAGSKHAGPQHLHTLDVSSNPLGPSGGQALADGFLEGGASPASPTELNLADTAVGDVAVEALAHSLGGGSGSSGCNLRKLDLSRCSLQGSAAAEVVRQVTGLQRLVLAGNALSPVAVVDLANAIVAASSLWELDLSENKVPLTSEALVALAGVRTLQKLSLFAGAVGDVGFAAVTAAIAAGSWPVLQQLDIGGCELSSAAVSGLFLALAAGAMPDLQVLLLGANPAVQDPDSFEGVAAPLHQARPGLDIVWRASGGFETQQQ